MEADDLRVEITVADVELARRALIDAAWADASDARLRQLTGDIVRLVHAFAEQVAEDAVRWGRR